MACFRNCFVVFTPECCSWHSFVYCHLWFSFLDKITLPVYFCLPRISCCHSFRLSIDFLLFLCPFYFFSFWFWFSLCESSSDALSKSINKFFANTYFHFILHFWSGSTWFMLWQKDALVLSIWSFFRSDISKIPGVILPSKSFVAHPPLMKSSFRTDHFWLYFALNILFSIFGH